MKQVSKFVANDGTEFDSALDCQSHEVFLTRIAEARKLLPFVDVQGEGFVQLNPGNVLALQRRLAELFIEAHPTMRGNPHVEWVLKADVPAGQTLIGRYMDDCGPVALYSAWWRIMCIDKNFRQWSQPFYAALSDRGSR